MSSKLKPRKIFAPANLTRAALIAAIIFVMTSFLKLPTATGYVHLGDAAVLAAAALLPFPLGFITAALGGALADLAAGYPMWIIPTACIKALMTLAFTAKTRKVLSGRNCFAMAAAVLINAAGYYLAGSLIYGDFRVSLPEIPTNLLQGACGALLFAILGACLDASPGLRRLMRGNNAN